MAAAMLVGAPTVLRADSGLASPTSAGAPLGGMVSLDLLMGQPSATARDTLQVRSRRRRRRPGPPPPPAHTLPLDTLLFAHCRTCPAVNRRWTPATRWCSS